MISKVMDRVKHLLAVQPATRDCDQKLMAELWTKDCFGMYIGLKSTSVLGFLEMYSENKFTSPASVVRSRRILQRKYPELRGDRYEERNVKLNNDVKNEIKQIESRLDDDIGNVKFFSF